MADFVAVLKKTLGGLGETTPEIRARVYDKARATIASKLAALDPQPPEAVAERQKKMLEDAIATVERDYAPPPPPPEPEIDPLAELENIFSSIDRNKNQQTCLLRSLAARPLPLRPHRCRPRLRQDRNRRRRHLLPSLPRRLLLLFRRKSRSHLQPLPRLPRT
jgi:hypothetical protein